MQNDLIKSYNLAHLALWRVDNYHLWVSFEEERFLKIAMEHPPKITF